MKTAVEFYRTELNALVSGRKTEYKTESEIFEKALEMEKEQNESILNYIKEVRDLCDKLRFPTEEELRELTIKADNIFIKL